MPGEYELIEDEPRHGDPKASELVREVAAKTRSGRIRWEPTATDDLVAAFGGEFALRLFPYGGDDPFRTSYALVLDDAQGRQLIRVDAGPGTGEASSLGAVPWNELSNLYEAARRQALRVNEKLDRALGELAKL